MAQMVLYFHKDKHCQDKLSSKGHGALFKSSIGWEDSTEHFLKTGHLCVHFFLKGLNFTAHRRVSVAELSNNAFMYNNAFIIFCYELNRKLKTFRFCGFCSQIWLADWLIEHNPNKPKLQYHISQ